MGRGVWYLGGEVVAALIDVVEVLFVDGQVSLDELHASVKLLVVVHLQLVEPLSLVASSRLTHHLITSRAQPLIQPHTSTCRQPHRLMTPVTVIRLK